MPAKLGILQCNFNGYRQGVWPRGFHIRTESVGDEVTVVVLTTVELLSSGGKKHV